MPIKESNVGIKANNVLLTRAQSFDFETTDVVAEIPEQGIDEIEHYITLPSPRRIHANCNFYGVLRNLRAVIGDSSDDDLDFEDLRTCSNLNFQIEKDNSLTYSLVFPDALLTEVSYSFNVEGFASENFSFSAYEYMILSGDKRDAVLVNGRTPVIIGDDHRSILMWLPPPHTDYTVVSQFIDGETVKQDANVELITENGDILSTFDITDDDNFTETGSRYATLLYRNTPSDRISGELDDNPLVGLPRAHVELSTVDEDEDLDDVRRNFLRVQSLDFTLSVGGSPIEEQGNYIPRYYSYRAYEIPIRCSILPDDLSSLDFFTSNGEDDILDVSKFDSFLKKAKMNISCFDKKDTILDRERTSLFTLSGLRLENYSWGSNVDANSTLDLNLVATSITISGS